MWHLALVAGQALPIGVAIAAELMREGADWTYCTDLWQRLVLLDHHATCVALDGPVEDISTGCEQPTAAGLPFYPTSSPLEPPR
jgi:hypothetical protein